MRYLAMLLACFLPFRTLAAQDVDASPQLTGVVRLNVAQGRLAADLCLRNYPSGYRSAFLLNKGLNIKFVKTGEGKSIRYWGEHELLRGKLVGEAIHYAINQDDAPNEPDALCIAYIGAFPVYAQGERKSIDFKGLIALTDKTFRATEQSKWHPTPYNADTDQSISQLAYDITIDCEDCPAVYLNGVGTKAGRDLRFTSDAPRAMVFFAGALNVQDVNGLNLINLRASQDASEVLRRRLDAVRAFQEDIMGEPIAETPTFVGMELLQPASGLSFASWPTVALGDVSNIEAIVADDGAHLTDYWEKTLAHEMGHYYFGTLFRNEGPLSFVFGEAFTEWMSLKFMAQEFSEETFGALLRDHAESSLGIENWKSLDTIDGPAQISDAYRYRYVPLLLMALEENIGADRMKAFMQAMLAERGGRAADYGLFRSAAAVAGVTPAEWSAFEQSCIRPAPPQSCIAKYEVAAH